MKRRPNKMKNGGWRIVQKSRRSSNLGVKSQRSRSPGTINALCTANTPSLGAYDWYANMVQQQRRAHFVAGRGCLQGLLHAASVLWGAVSRQFYAGGKISACCLVSVNNKISKLNWKIVKFLLKGRVQWTFTSESVKPKTCQS